MIRKKQMSGGTYLGGLTSHFTSTSEGTVNFSSEQTSGELKGHQVNESILGEGDVLIQGCATAGQDLLRG